MEDPATPEASWNFLGLPEDLVQPERAEVWVLPIPYEATTSYVPGTRKAPAAIVTASHQVELYDREFECEPASRFGVHTLPPLNLKHLPPEAMVGSVAEAVHGILTGTPAPKLLAVFGGEHSLSAGVARGTARALEADNLVVVQVDAHADLRQEYEGSPYSHACAARRILDTCPVFQIGIRNVSEGGDAFRRECPHVHTVFAEEAQADGPWRDRLARFVRGRAVYLTVDIDVLDPGIMPAVGTPEPGGITWERMLDITRVICRDAASLPVFDIVELAPISGMVSPDFLCARLAYKIMALARMPEKKRPKPRRQSLRRKAATRRKTSR